MNGPTLTAVIGAGVSLAVALAGYLRARTAHMTAKDARSTAHVALTMSQMTQPTPPAAPAPPAPVTPPPAGR